MVSRCGVRVLADAPALAVPVEDPLVEELAEAVRAPVFIFGGYARVLAEEVLTGRRGFTGDVDMYVPCGVDASEVCRAASRVVERYGLECSVSLLSAGVLALTSDPCVRVAVPAADPAPCVHALSAADFRVASLAVDVRRRLLLDCTGGLADVAAGRLDTVGDPLDTLLGDPVVLLRALYYTRRHGYRPTPRLAGAIAEALSDRQYREEAEEILRKARQPCIKKIRDTIGTTLPTANPPAPGPETKFSNSNYSSNHS